MAMVLTSWAEFELSGLPQRGRGEITINVTMSVDKVKGAEVKEEQASLIGRSSRTES